MMHRFSTHRLTVSAKITAFATALVAAMALLSPAADASPVEQIQVDAPADARGEGAIDDEDGEKNPRVESTLVLDTKNIAPGDTLRAGVLFTMDENWHIYWRNSGDAGMATTIDFTAGVGSIEDNADDASANLADNELQWPAPKVYERPNGDIITFGYGGQVLLFTTITVPDSASSGDSLQIRAKPNYLACEVECIPGSSTLTRTVDITDSTERLDESSPAARVFRRAATKVPRTPEQLGIAADVAYGETPIRSSATVDAALGLDMCPEGPDSCETWSVVSEHDNFAFIPDSTSQVEWTTTGVGKHPKSPRGEVIRLEGEASPNDPEDNERFAGVVHLENNAGAHRAVLIDDDLPRGKSDAETTTNDNPLLTVEVSNDDSAAAAASAAAGTQSTGGAADASSASSESSSTQSNPLGLWQALLFAFLGGAILNLMPCVFPVLALKVSSFTKLVHEDRSHILAHGAAYTGGIVGSMLVLAAVVLGLRVAGTQVGWGFQFQNPVFPALLTGVMVLFAMNLFGAFEVNVSANELAKSTKQSSGLSRSAGEGVLAVVLATPCSAPFLGTAVGFALAAGAPTIIGVFTMLGLGLAAPFVVLTLVPGWAKVLPNPGEWMVVFKQLLGFALLGTGIWLVWIVGRTQGVNGMMYVLIFAGMVAIAAWLFGWLQAAQPERFPWLGAAGALMIIAGSGVWTLDFPETDASTVGDPKLAASAGQNSDQSQGSTSGINWKRWTRDKVDKELDKGNAVFVDFTADWCITCKVNERNVLATDKVHKTLDKCGVTSFKADWTDGSERIRSKLAEHGKGGVPMYLVYSPDKPEDPQLLPELLTTDIVVSALEKAGC